ncbi:hypothetical protein [Arthrobacter sp. OAP107]|uniref:hypothetical protein n=1 Tax=Arthrobacter sp. OAP107 TaxID=3156445 RepID=UPI00339B951A
MLWPLAATGWLRHGIATVLVTVDLNLPDMAGLDVARHIRTRSEAPMLCITARVDPDDEMAGRASGASQSESGFLVHGYVTQDLADEAPNLPSDDPSARWRGQRISFRHG